MGRTKIEWADRVWNPVTGCSPVGPGCLNCYARRMAHRLKAMGHRRYMLGFDPSYHEDALEEPRTWRKPQRVFVASMGDVFHLSIPRTFLKRLFHRMRCEAQHTFMVLTKRPERAFELRDRLTWAPNIWLGVSVENAAAAADRLPYLASLAIPGRRFIAAEPLLGPIDHLQLTGLDWVIAGGETGPGARPLEPQWVLDLRDRCVEKGVPFFFKGWGTAGHRQRGFREIEGRLWEEVPAPKHPMVTKGD